jgi:hypothetical protein
MIKRKKKEKKRWGEMREGKYLVNRHTHHVRSERDDDDGATHTHKAVQGSSISRLSRQPTGGPLVDGGGGDGREERKKEEEEDFFLFF